MLHLNTWQTYPALNMDPADAHFPNLFLDSLWDQLARISTLTPPLASLLTVLWFLDHLPQNSLIFSPLVVGNLEYGAQDIYAPAKEQSLLPSPHLSLQVPKPEPHQSPRPPEPEFLKDADFEPLLCAELEAKLLFCHRSESAKLLLHSQALRRGPPDHPPNNHQVWERSPGHPPVWLSTPVSVIFLTWLSFPPCVLKLLLSYLSLQHHCDVSPWCVLTSQFSLGRWWSALPSSSLLSVNFLAFTCVLWRGPCCTCRSVN